jgi:hypothetical protein
MGVVECTQVEVRDDVAVVQEDGAVAPKKVSGMHQSAGGVKRPTCFMRHAHVDAETVAFPYHFLDAFREVVRGDDNALSACLDEA